MRHTRFGFMLGIAIATFAMTTYAADTDPSVKMVAQGARTAVSVTQGENAQPLVKKTVSQKAVNPEQALMEKHESIKKQRMSGSSEAKPAEMPQTERTMNILTRRFSEGIVTPPKRAPRRAGEATPGLAEGTWIAKDILYPDGTIEGEKMTIESSSTTNTTKFTVTGLWGIYSKDINLVYDAEAGTVTINGKQTLINVSPYGNFAICAFDPEKGTYDPDGNLVGTINADGSVTFPAWGLFVRTGTYKGTSLAQFSGSTWHLPNATMTTTGPNKNDNRTDVPMYVEQAGSDKALFYCFMGYNNVMAARLTPSETVQMTPQLIYTAQAGPVKNYPLIEYDPETQKGQVNWNGVTTGHKTDTGLSLDPWIAGVESGALAGYFLLTTDIKLDSPLTYPAPITVNWAGKGTSDDPYILTKADDFVALAESVETGESYAGVTFKVGNDIDMKTMTRSWLPIGSMTNAFEGTLDGNGKTLRNLTIDTYGLPYGGMFGQLGSKSKVTNLKIAGATLKAEGVNAGILAAMSNGVIENVSITGGDVATACESTGGLVGQNKGTINKSSFEGSVKGNGTIAGLAGFNLGVVNGCHAQAEVTLTGVYSEMYHEAAGLVAYNMSRELEDGGGVIRDSWFAGTVEDKSGQSNIGGLVCTAYESVIERCFNAGSVYGLLSTEDEDVHNIAGGLAGYIYHSKVSDCYNSGLVMGRVSVDAEFRAVGGLIGYVNVSMVSSGGDTWWKGISTVKNCYNSGQVLSANENPMQGIYGRTWDGREQELEEATFTNVYDDLQINHCDNTKYGRLTSYLTNTMLPSGFSADIWQVTAGNYPSIKNLASTEASKMSTGAIVMADNQWIDKIKKSAKLNVQGPAKWQLLSEDTGSSVAAGELKVGPNYATVILGCVSTAGGRLYRAQVVPDIYQGSGTADDPYVLKTVDDWKNLSAGVGVYEQHHEGDYFQMGNDIDFADSDFRGVGVKGNTTFDGIFDGKGFQVKNLTLDGAQKNANGSLNTSNSYWYSALFSMVGKPGKLSNITIAAGGTLEVYHYGAAVVGLLYGTAENCRNYSDLNCWGQYAGAIAGGMPDSGKLTGCYNAGKIYAAHNNALGVAGIAGYVMGSVNNSQNDGGVSMLSTNTKGIAAGIVAMNYGNVNNCVNTATISGATAVGGIIGSVSYYNADGNMNGCVNSGIAVLTAEGLAVGGMVGTGDLGRNSTNNYFDSSINVDGAIYSAGNPAFKGLSTSEMVEGKAFEGLQAGLFDWTAGSYPVLAAFKNEPLAKTLRSIYIKFGNGQVRNNLSGEIPMSATAGMDWKLENTESTNFAIEEGKLKVTIPTELTLVSNVVNAMQGEAVVKSYPVAALPVYLEGKGTADAPYLIKNKDEWKQLSEFVYNNRMSYKGTHFRLMADLDYKDEEFPMIAALPLNRKEEIKFQGELDGNGHSITNVDWTYSGTSTAIYSGGDRGGVVGVLGELGYVHHLTTSGSLVGLRYLGGIVGECYGKVTDSKSSMHINTKSDAGGGIVGKLKSGGHISDCEYTGEVYTQHSYGAGGIAGLIEGNTTVEKCVNRGTITTSAKGYEAGGIVGNASGNVLDCQNYGKLVSENTTPKSPTKYYGGIIGTTSNTAMKVANCVNYADIEPGNVAMAAGIIGGQTGNRNKEKWPLTVENCVNKGKVTAIGHIGGIMGYVPGGTTIQDCVNEGDITVSLPDGLTGTLGSTSSGTGSGYAGGIAGHTNGQSTDPTHTGFMLITRCGNSGTITNPVSCTGGITGYSWYGAITYCYNTGRVESMSYNPSNGNLASYKVGGISGDPSCLIDHCWNSGEIHSDGHDIGGIVGLQGEAITNCVNIGNVTVESSAYNSSLRFEPTGGGVLGRGNGDAVTNVINLGEVKCPDRAAGLMSMMVRESVFENSYNAGKVSNTREGAEYISNTANTQDTFTDDPFSAIFYQKDLNPNIGENYYDNKSMALTYAELCGATLGNGFIIQKAGLPMVKDLFNGARPHFRVADISFANAEDTKENVTDLVNITVLPDLTWTSSDNFEISGALAIPRELGEGWLKVETADGESKTFELNVTKALPKIIMPTGVKVDPAEKEADIETGFKVTAVLEPADVTEQERTIVWSSTNTDVAVVTQDGEVTCLTPGECEIVATTVNSLTGSCKLTVKEMYPTSITLDKTEYNGKIGDEFDLTATLEPANATATDLVWSSDAPAICLVDGFGHVTLIATGEAVITATTENGLSASCQVTSESGVDGLYIDGKEVREIRWYSADGKELAAPVDGTVNVMTFIFTDGTSKSRTVMTSVRK